MDNRLLNHHYSLLVPLLIGFISTLGICLILGFAWIPRPSTAPVPSQTLTPFKYLLLATETIVPTSKPETTLSDASLPRPVSTLELGVTLLPQYAGQVGGSDGALSISSNEETAITTDADFFTPTVTITPNPIFDESDSMAVGTYDDTDLQIIRTGNWISQNNVDAYQGTLLVSKTVGNYVAFSFTGQQMVFGFQSSANAGDLTVNIDGSELTITQLVGNQWISQELEPGTHFVILTHESGTTVNLDYIDILE